MSTHYALLKKNPVCFVAFHELYLIGLNENAIEKVQPSSKINHNKKLGIF